MSFENPRCQANSRQDSVICLVLELSGGMQIYIRTLTGTQTQTRLEAGRLDTIDNIKTKIQDKLGVQKDQQRLIFNGRLLEGFRSLYLRKFVVSNIYTDGRTLADYGVSRVIFFAFDTLIRCFTNCGLSKCRNLHLFLSPI
jgi:ubiquitin